MLSPLRNSAGRVRRLTAMVFVSFVYIFTFHGDAEAVAETVSHKRAGSAPMVLILPEEARQGPYRMRGADLSERGPRIIVSSPRLDATYDAAFPLHVVFQKGAKGYPVNMHSLRLTYRRGWGIDITDRIIDYVTGREIIVPEVDLPPGKHAVEIYIEDAKKNVSRMLFSVKVAEHD